MNFNFRTEAERLQRRKEARRRIAELTVILSRRETCLDALKRIDGESEAADSLHKSATEPLREQLEAIESQRTDNLLNGVSDAKLDREHSKLLAKIQDENIKLERVLNQCKLDRETIQRELASFSQAYNEKLTLEGALVGTFANSKLFGERQGYQQLHAQLLDVHAHGAAKLQAAKDNLERAQQSRDESERRKAEISIGRWTAWVEAANAYVDDCRNRGEQAARAIADE